MAEPITPERLAVLRERYERGDDDAIELLLELIAVGMDPFTKPKPRDNWIESLKQYQVDHVALLAEVERLQAALAEEIESSRAELAHTEERATRMAW